MRAEAAYVCMYNPAADADNSRSETALNAMTLTIRYTYIVLEEYVGHY